MAESVERPAPAESAPKAPSAPGRRKKWQQSWPLLVLQAALYAGMLLLIVLCFATGGEFIYEAF